MAEVVITFGVGPAVGRVPTQLQQGVERLGDRLAQAPVEGQIQRPEMMMEVVGAKPRGEPHVVGGGDVPIVEALATDAVARKEGLVPDFDIVARGRVIVEPLDPRIVAAAYPVLDGTKFPGAGLFAGIAEEGLGGNGQAFR